MEELEIQKEVRKKLSQRKLIKNIISWGIILVLIMSVFFGYTFYKQSLESEEQSKEIDVLLLNDDLEVSNRKGEFIEMANLAKQYQNKFPTDPYGYLAESIGYIRYSLVSSDYSNFLDTAEGSINKLLEFDQNNSEAYRILGDIKQIQLDYDTAAEMYEKSIRLDSNNSHNYDSRGYLYYISGNDDLARENYLKALELDFENKRALTNLALSYLRSEEISGFDIEEMLLRSIDISDTKTTLAEAYHALGLLYLYSEKYTESIKAFTKATENDPTLAASYNGIGMASFYIMTNKKINSGEFSQLMKSGVSSVEKAIEINPNFSRAHVTLGWFYIFTPDRELERSKYLDALEVIDSDLTLSLGEKEEVLVFVNQLINNLEDQKRYDNCEFVIVKGYKYCNNNNSLRTSINEELVKNIRPIYLTGNKSYISNLDSILIIEKTKVDDMCMNRSGIQFKIPDGFFDIGGRICKLDSSKFSVFCRALKNPVLPGTKVTFIALPFNKSEGEVKYNWSDNNTKKKLKEELNEGRSTINHTFNNIGVHRLAISALDNNGSLSQSTCGITVLNNKDEIKKEIQRNIESEPQITLKGGGITNTTCPIEWTAKNVNECWIISDNGLFKQIDFDKNDGIKRDRVGPGEYKLLCVNELAETKIIETKPISCNLNK